MTIRELDELKADLHAVREALDRHSGLLRQVTASGFLALLSLPYGILALAFGVGSQIILGGKKGSELPEWWGLVFWGLFLALLAAGGVLKIRAFKRRAAELDAELWSVYRAFFDPESLHLVLASLLCLAGVSVFALVSGHPWYIVPAFSCWYGIYFLALSGSIRRLEYLAAGWYGLVAGTLSLFSLETAPFLWLGLTFGGVLLLFGVLGLLERAREARKAGKDEASP